MIVKQNEGFVKKYFHEMGDFSRAFIISVSSFRFLFPIFFMSVYNHRKLYSFSFSLILSFNPDYMHMSTSTSLFSSS